MNSVIDAQFIGSFPKTEMCPPTEIPEYAFIGRSNVGKSSLINHITARKALAKVSGTPGKTQLINFFKINDSWHLVDLPGYGYARVSKKDRAVFDRMIRHFLKNREQLTCLFVLLDCSIAPQKIDLEFIDWLGQQEIPFCIVYTKADKDKQNAVSKNIQKIKSALSERWAALPLQFITSSTKNRGRTEILDYIAQVNENFYSTEE